MIPLELLEDYLIDASDQRSEAASPQAKHQDEGLKRLLTWFLNLVMQLEAIQQADAEPYQRSESWKAHRKRLQREISEDARWRAQTQETSIP